MSGSVSPVRNDQEVAAAPPSDSVRTAVTLLVIVHLFAVVAVMAFWATRPITGNATQRESFVERLHNVSFLTGHLQLLFQDLGYNYFLTQADQLDVDHQFVFDLKLQDGTKREATLPQPDLWPGIRRQRMQILANLAGQRIGEDGAESILPRLTAGYMARKYDAVSGTVRLRAHLLVPPENVRSPDSKLSDPFAAAYYRTPYEAQMLVRSGQVSLLKAAAAGETAPSAGRAPRTSPGTPPAPGGNP
ncbi:MAG: hypothetical protein K1X74_11795 [Pirellulales bacterium]|nr:hypothetical protein [Pirellulales bacterium]